MDLNLFSTLLQNLLHIHISYTQGGNAVFQAFQDKFCYSPVLQPAFTAEVLVRLTAEMDDTTLYSMQDDLGICLYFFRFDHNIFLAGPFVRTDYNATKTNAVLIAHHTPVSFASSVRLYYRAFPIISSTHVRNTILACIRSFMDRAVDYSHCHLRNIDGESPLPSPFQNASLDYSSLYRRYDLENRFLRMIETGDTENVLTAYFEMSMDRMTENRYVNAVYMEPAVGFSMIRALARKAAERGGASLVEIHEITQRSVQEMVSASNRNALTDITAKMILSLTEAVRRNRTNLGSFSPAIRKVVEHIQLNFSQEIPISYLAKLSGFSENYLSKAFRREVGSTVAQYTAHLRCKLAAQMLRETDSSIQEISSYVGYEDNNYFVKVFRKQYGMTPSAYRTEQTQI